MFLDANIFINAFWRNDLSGQKCREYLRRIRWQEHATTSPLVISEVIFVLKENKGEEFALKTARNILKIQNLKILDINKISCDYAIDYVTNGLDPKDAFHAALMKQNGIKTICSYDRDFDEISEIKRKEP